MDSVESYRDAAADRLNESHVAYTNGHYVLAVYLAGVAVECVFRASAQKAGVGFDSKHDLPKWLKASQFAEVANERQARAVASHVVELWRRWKNKYRYADAIAYRRALRKLDPSLIDGIKGDPVKENARRALDAASGILTRALRRLHER